MNKSDPVTLSPGGERLGDGEICDLFFARDERALSLTAEKYGRLFFGISMRILGVEQDAEECVNDTYMKLWGSIPPERPASLSAYGGRIARNLSINRAEYYGAQRRGGGDILEELDESVPDDSPSPLETGEISRHIDAFLRGCDRESRVMFVLRYWYCMSIEEIASRFGSSVSLVKGRLFRTRKKLKGYLEKDGVSL